MLTPCTVKGGKGKKGKGKGKNKGDRPRHDGKGKGEQSVKQRHFDGYCNQCGEYGHKKPDCAGKNKFFNVARVTNVEHMDTRELTVLLKRWHIWNPNL